ncbi:hypothetical protein [Streptomyces sp. B21-083]|uniref:hypothetical protein n=1 Tax=Streptomyces sp. B21-083 TaxID=3039410 RepID=UPI002FEF66C8
MYERKCQDSLHALQAPAPLLSLAALRTREHGGTGAERATTSGSSPATKGVEIAPRFLNGVIRFSGRTEHSVGDDPKTTSV